MTDFADLNRQVRAYSLKHKLFSPGVIVVGVSGGADSLTLLHLLKVLQTELQIELHVATLDHGIRGAESAADAAYVREVAEVWALPVTVGYADVPAHAHGGGLEAAARQARYNFLRQVAQNIGAQTIAVGHNRDDQAETVLMHLLRGSGLAGLRGMLPLTEGDPQIARPLLNTPRAAIDAYAAAHDLRPRTDSTNTDTAYTRNRLRLEILPLLRSINPALDEALAHTAETARADYQTLALALPVTPAEPLSRAEFLALPLGLRRLFIRQSVTRLSFGDHELSFDQVENALAFIVRGKPGLWAELPDGLRLHLIFDRLHFLRTLSGDEPPPLDAPALASGAYLPITIPSVISLDGWQLTARWLDVDEDAERLYRDPLCGVLTVPPEAVLALRSRRAGDRFLPQGMAGHSQKLSDTLINMHVPAAWRERVPLLTINDQIAWLVVPTAQGLQGRIAEPFRIQSFLNKRIGVLCYERIGRS